MRGTAIRYFNKISIGAKIHKQTHKHTHDCDMKQYSMAQMHSTHIYYYYYFWLLFQCVVHTLSRFFIWFDGISVYIASVPRMHTYKTGNGFYLANDINVGNVCKAIKLYGLQGIINITIICSRFWLHGFFD